jgi:hypothetical protein
MNKNWPRWIIASIAEHFRIASAAIPLPLLVDGIDEREDELLHYDHAELRFTGPYINELSHNYYRLLIDANILLTEMMDRSNAYDIHTWCGAMAVAMEGPINVYKYGTEVGDDASYAFCLTLANGKIDPVRVLHFGQSGLSTRFRQSMIDGHFIVDISV